jgi:hypothetical protein
MAKVGLSASLRSKTIRRAQKRCEYCQKPDDREFNSASHEVDHIIAEKHGGKTRLDNLAYACLQCNRYKGTDYRSFDPHTGTDIRLFNPRIQHWNEHFTLNTDGTIAGRTPEGRTTARLLRFNDPTRTEQRADLIAAGRLTATQAFSREEG